MCIRDSSRALQGDVPLLMVKESIYVVSLCAKSSGVIGEVKQVFDLRQRLSDAELQDEINLMAGGGGSVLRTVAENLKVELGDVKQSLDMASQGVADTDYGDVADTLLRVAGTLVMINLNKESQQIKARAANVRTWTVDQVDPQGLDFQELVDDLLLVELSLIHISEPTRPY